ncbi:hypothetical protein C2845_PM06G28530 [Panicum miliaceum]|uniref:Uncharacterized protein n=1 Tax=Panicum miliaceum TaxID=4540 RepID=A0A3L6R6H1_PANMI|nr:hypothetical protein C2845_PM06G28530 [Panicum miliaceum]
MCCWSLHDGQIVWAHAAGTVWMPIDPPLALVRASVPPDLPMSKSPLVSSSLWMATPLALPVVRDFALDAGSKSLVVRGSRATYAAT